MVAKEERDAQAHHTTDAVRAAESEIVGGHGSEILPHKECLNWSEMEVTETPTA
jgi:hypothetical protein